MCPKRINDPPPATINDWHKQVQRFGVGALKLTDISAKPLSGSRMHTQGFLQLRAIFPPKKVGVNVKSKLVNPEDFKLASDLIEHMGLRNDCLDLFLNEINTNTKYDTPPSRSRAFDHLRFGWFGPSLVHWRLLNMDGHTRPHADRASYASAAKSQPRKRDLSPLRVSQFDPYKSAPGKDPVDDASAAASAMEGLDIDDIPDTPSRLSVNRGSRQTSRAQLSSAALLGSTTTAPDPAPDAEATSSSSGVRQRTNYEVKTTIFFTTYLSSLYGYVLSPECDMHITVEAEEHQNRFGPKQGPGGGKGGGGGSKAGFTAVPDGVFYCKRPEGNLIPFAFFEMKREKRESSAATNRDICHEETAEIAAILYEQFCNKSSALELDRKHERLMVSLDHGEFWITCASFTGRYLKYLTNMENMALPEPDRTHLASEFIHYQRFGPFYVGSRQDMDLFNRVMVALALGRARETTEGKSFYDRCKAATMM